MQNLIVGANFDENLASSLVQNLGENVKVTGRIIWPNLEAGKRAVLVEIEDEKDRKTLFLFQLTVCMEILWYLKVTVMR